MQTPRVVCKIQCDWERVQGFAQVRKDVGNLQTLRNPNSGTGLVRR